MITTVVGNYPKVSPRSKASSLRTAWARFETGQITQEELEQVMDEVTKEVLEEQAEAGVDLVTDGQIRWEDGQTYFARRVRGFSIDGLTRYFDTNTYFRQPVVDGQLEWQGPITVKDFLFAKAHSPRPVKPVITGPYTLARLSQAGAADLPSLVRELARVLNREALALQEAGAEIVQFDEPAILKWKEDFPLLEEAATILTKELTITTALYTYFKDASGLVPQLFQLPFQVIGLDFVMGPANYQLIEGFPTVRHLAAGIVDARNTRLESVPELMKSIEQIAPFVPLDRLYVNPSCGLEFLPRLNAQAKLARMVEGVSKAQEVL
ncbi:MAG: methylcobamide--CoM methyltransferase [Dehalococcoidia bacterium]